jgi:hypothetical protein
VIGAGVFYLCPRRSDDRVVQLVACWVAIAALVTIVLLALAESEPGSGDHAADRLGVTTTVTSHRSPDRTGR